MSRDFDTEGRKAGGKLAQGINSGLIRHSPLIAAAVGGALMAGAPVAIAGAAMLFGGIGAVAAAQSSQVREAWVDLGHEIAAGAVSDARVLVPELTLMASDLGAAFQRLRPQLRDAFQASAPLVQTFTEGITGAAENAMPGLVRAVQSAGPVMDGFASFLGSIGTGLGEFFGAVSEHGPAAGQAFESLGRIVGALLPTLGELLGTGVELASVVLPPLASALELVADVASQLGPVLPMLVAGFLAFKAAKVAAGYVQTFAVQAQYAAIAATGSVAAGERVGGAMSKMGRAIDGAGKSLPLLSAGFMLAASIMADSERQTETWAQALLEGGQAAATAREQMADQSRVMQEAQSGWLQFGIGATGAGAAVATFGDDVDKATQAVDDYEDSLSPTQRAQHELNQATNELSQALKDHGDAHPKVIAAQKAYESAVRENERAQAELEQAIHGVTSAMVEQAAQALLSVNSELAYDAALDDLEDSERAVAEAIREHGAASEEASDASRGLAEDTIAAAEAAGKMAADALPANTSELERNAAAQSATLGELIRLRNEMGSNFPAAGQRAIDRLQSAGVSLTGTGAAAANTAQRMRDLGLSVTQVPGNKSIFINAPTADQKRRLEELGLTVRYLPNGRIVVVADTGPAEGSIAALINRRRTLQIQAVITGGNYYQGAGQQPRAATGGEVVPGGIRRDIGGPIWGPGGPTDDMVPALGPGGVRYRLSNGEHILTAAEVRAAGGHGAIREWRATLLESARGFAAGGAVAAPAERGGRSGALFHAETVNVIEGTPREIAEELVYAGRTRGW